MANAVKCDRCGEYYESRLDCEIFINRKLANNTLIAADLCSNCQRDLEDFMAGSTVCTNIKIGFQG
jgi:hypothetical protein